MPTGPKPQPKHLKLLKGERRPSRVNYDEPEFNDDDIRPSCELTDAEMVVWKQLVPELSRTRVITNADISALTHLAQIETMAREAHDNYKKTGMFGKGSKGQLIISPTLKVSMELRREAVRLLSEFGMTPSARQRVKSGAAPPSQERRGFDLD